MQKEPITLKAWIDEPLHSPNTEHERFEWSRKVLAEKKLRIEMLAKKLKLHPQSIKNYASGRTKPSMVKAQLISDTLGFPIVWTIGKTTLTILPRA